jgi:hypothetical protein
MVIPGLIWPYPECGVFGHHTIFFKVDLLTSTTRERPKSDSRASARGVLAMVS